MDEPAPPSKPAVYLKWIMYGAVVLIGLSLALIMYWLYQPTPVLEFHQKPIPVRTIRKHPTAGGVVILKVDYCKKVGATGEVRTSFVSGSREIFLPKANDEQPEQCLVTEFPVLIPEGTPAGTYKIKFSIDYEVNPLKHSVEEIESAEFEIR